MGIFLKTFKTLEQLFLYNTSGQPILSLETILIVFTPLFKGGQFRITCWKSSWLKMH